MSSKVRDHRYPPTSRTIRIPEFRIPYENEYPAFQSLERLLVVARPTLERQLKEAELAGDTEKLKSINTEIEKMNGMYPTLLEDASKAARFLVDLDASNKSKKEWYTKERVASFEEREEAL